MIHFQNPTDELSGTEVSQSGAVSFSDFKYYLRHFGSIGYLVLIAFVWICVNMSSSLWISIWTDQSGKEDAFAQWVYLAVFGGLGCLEALVVCCQAIILFLSAVRASTTVHEEMVQKLLSVPLSYFDSHSSGFVLNRFLQDLGSIDSSVPHTLMETISRTFSIAAQFMFIVFITPFVLVIAPFVIVFYIFVATTFRTAARDTRRLESASRSPVYDLFGDVLNGLESVQCFGAQGRFESWNLRLVERMSSCKVGNEAVNKWAQALIVQSSCVFYFFSGFIGVSLLYQGVISVSSFGLVLMYAANLQRALMDYVMGLTNLETNFVAVERVVEFVKERSGKEDSGSFGPAQWPADGCLDVEQLRLRYTINREEVLKGVSFSVKPGENIAVIGRTGCGKSSLMAALSQQYPPSNGDILIDGVDVSTVSPKKMRDIIRIIPQETMLFDGTIRDNVLLGREDIDDAKIWDTLALVQLKERIAKMSGGLDAEIQFGGSDFSAGERQLLCLARALSSGVTPKVLICDEVTANVDLETDFMVLDVLMKFPSSVIMVMHRLEHLDKFDKVLMLNKGRVIEYAHASELMQDSEEFRNFVQHNAE
ncbi:P-loop containing nucleoside triphosphate hydrolase protein [Chytriomyces sp. MP71]|nr:P-loop containing nucleoside triphosphate hydrolase protein [Chytriomyces sp. MP71]